MTPASRKPHNDKLGVFQCFVDTKYKSGLCVVYHINPQSLYNFIITRLKSSSVITIKYKMSVSENTMECLNRGVMFAKEGNFVNAELEYNKALKLEGNIKFYGELSLILEKQGKFEEASVAENKRLSLIWHVPCSMLC